MLNIMGMRLVQAGRRDPMEVRFRAEFLDVAGADISHAPTQTLHVLMEQIGDRTLIRDGSFYAFGHDLIFGCFALTISLP